MDVPKHLDEYLAQVNTQKIFAEWMNGQVKTVHKKYSLGTDIPFWFYNQNI